MPSYKLTYFEGRGRAEAIRMMFSLAGVDFEDNRITKEEWVVLKSKTRYGHLPELEIDGKVFGQSNAILQYLAREYGYYGKTNLESLEVDQVLCTMEDLIQAATKVYHGPEEQREGLTNEFLEVHLPKYLGILEKFLKDNGTGVFVGKSTTVADVLSCAIIPQLTGRHPGCADAFPLLLECIKTVENQDGVKAYMKKRPEEDTH